MAQKKYFKSKKMAIKRAENINDHLFIRKVEVFKMPKGTRHHGMYFVGDYMEWLNYAN